jgi:hypothetical protein
MIALLLYLPRQRLAAHDWLCFRCGRILCELEQQYMFATRDDLMEWAYMIARNET